MKSLFVALLLFLRTTLPGLGAAKSPLAEARTRPVGIDTTFGDRFHEAAAALKANRYDEVIAKTDAALAMKPDNKNAAFLYLWSGIAHEARGDYGSAISDYSNAIRCNPAMNEAYGRRGPLYTRTGNYGGAIADLTRFLRADKSDSSTYVARGGAYLKNGNKEAARKDLETFLRMPARQAWDHAAKGKIYFALGQYQNAAAELATAKRIGGDSYILQYVLNETAWFEATCPQDGFRNAKAAVSDATRACQLSHWKDPGTIDTLAAAYAEAGDFNRAVATVNQAIPMEAALPAERKELVEHLRQFQAQKAHREESKFR
jgi:tetratricopeptide (TPR) repeat protein